MTNGISDVLGINKRIFFEERCLAGVVVLYYPEQNIIKNIETYIEILDVLYIIDNSSEDFHFKDKLMNFKKIKYVRFKENKGIACALNYALHQAENYQWLLTMDQDSFFSSGDAKRFKKSLQEVQRLERIIIIAPRYKTIGETFINTKIEKYVKTKKVITSGNLLNIKLARKLNGFNEKFFIDEVDFEFCFRAIKNGYQIYVNQQIILNHSIGEQKLYKKIKGLILFQSTNHSPIRRYYMTRNRLYMMKKYSEVRIEYARNILSDLIKILWVENNKLDKIKYIFLGLLDFFRNKVGKLKDGGD